MSPHRKFPVMVDPDAVAVGDFLEADADGSIEPGVYRVVGNPNGTLVCLRVTDDRGKRVATGELARFSAADASALEPVSEPRKTIPGMLKNQIEGPYWMVRSVLPF
jgi:hypothetical protein